MERHHHLAFLTAVTHIYKSSETSGLLYDTWRIQCVTHREAARPEIPHVGRGKMFAALA